MKRIVESPPARVVWIEMAIAGSVAAEPASPPARVVWIEMEISVVSNAHEMSPPARVVWIEILDGLNVHGALLVATREGGVD